MNVLGRRCALPGLTGAAGRYERLLITDTARALGRHCALPSLTGAADRSQRRPITDKTHVS